MTRPGVILGTAAYMSPEQAKGKSVDKRADIWAFGCILYECLTGKRAFEGETVTETLAAILKGEPDWQALPSATPPSIRFVLRRCLEKDMSRRFRDAADARIQIEEAVAAPPERIVLARKFSGRLAWWIAAFFFVAFVAALAVALMHIDRAPANLMPARLSIETPEGATLASGGGSAAAPWPTVSPDGRRIVFGAIGIDKRPMLWLRALDSSAAQPLPGTDGGEQPFWSPDSRFIAFFAQGKLKKIDVSGGAPITLCDAEGFTREGSWGREGVILFSISGKTVFRVPETGGRPTAATVFDEARKETNHFYPSFLPDGLHFLYSAQSTDDSQGGLFVGRLGSSETKFVRASYSKARYSPPGFLLFVRDGTLVAQPFDERRFQLSGDTIPIAERIRYRPISGIAAFSVSETGVLTYVAGDVNPQGQMIWYDRAGKQLGALGDPAWFSDIKLSPDGKRVAVSVADQAGKTNDIWLYDVARGLRKRFTFDPADDAGPIWSVDASRVVFSSDRKGRYDIYQKASNGAGIEEVILEDSASKYPGGLSPNGQFLLYGELGPVPSMRVLPLSVDRKAFPFSNGFSGQFSPDGRWVTFDSDESSRSEVYVAPFPGSVAKWQVSTAGGEFPRWNGDGSEIFYISTENKLMAAEVNGKGSSFEVGNVKPLFGLQHTVYTNWYDVSPDGRRFLIVTTLEQTATPAPISVILNWTSLLKK
jgi:Tol biopolymer transport system component